MTDDRIAAIRERCDKIEGDAWGNADGYDPDLANAGICVREMRAFLILLNERDAEIDRLNAELFGKTEQLEAAKSELLQKTQQLEASHRREQAERGKGCEYCNNAEEMAYGMNALKRTAHIYIDGNLLTADLYSDSMAVAVCYCPMCGRKLKEANNATD